MTDDRLKSEQLREIVAVTKLITSSLDAAEVRRRAVEAATRLVNAERASLLLLDRRGGQLYFEVALGEDLEKLRRVRLVQGQGIAGSVLETCAPAIVNDVPSDTRYCADFDSETGFVTRSMLCVPLSCGKQRLGVLEVINKTTGDFDDDDLAVTVALANQVAIAVENARLHDRLRKGFVEATVYAVLLAAVFIAAGAWLVSLGR